MRLLSFGLLGLALAASTGCNELGSDEAAGTLLSQGTNTAASGTETTLVEVTACASGTLVGRVTWTGGPGTMTCSFLHLGSSAVVGIETGSSTLMTTVSVNEAHVAAGDRWRFRVTHSGGGAVSVSYEVRFISEHPDCGCGG